MKTIREWFNELPDGYRELALANCTDPDRKVENMSEALYHGFVWAESPQSHAFWSAVNYYYLPQSKLPPLPKKKITHQIRNHEQRN